MPNQITSFPPPAGIPVAVPTGTGFPHVTSGTLDAAAKLVENADVHSSAAIATSKLADGWKLALAAAATTLNSDVNVASVSAVDLVSESITVAAGDIIEVEAWGTLLNDSGAARTYTATFVAGSLSAAATYSATINFSPTNRIVMEFRMRFTVQSSSSANMIGTVYTGEPSASSTAQRLTVTTSPRTWNTSGSDLTGSQTFKIQMTSSSATGTQTFTVGGYYARKINAP